MAKYPDTIRDRAVREVMDSRQSNESLAATCRRVGEDLGINPRTLRSWIVRSADVQTAAPSAAATEAATSSDSQSASPSEPSRSSTFRRPRWKSISGDVLGALAGAAPAGIGQAVGTAHLPWIVLLLLGAELAMIGFVVAHALQVESATAKLHWWQTGFIVLALLPAGTTVYHFWFDPSSRMPITYEMVVNGNEADVVPLFGEAGGHEQLLATGAAGQNGLIGGQTYQFDCRVTAPDGTPWLRYQRFGQTWWAPQQDLHPPVGLSPPIIPHC